MILDAYLLCSFVVEFPSKLLQFVQAYRFIYQL